MEQLIDSIYKDLEKELISKREYTLKNIVDHKDYKQDGLFSSPLEYLENLDATTDDEDTLWSQGFLAGLQRAIEILEPHYAEDSNSKVLRELKKCLALHLKDDSYFLRKIRNRYNFIVVIESLLKNLISIDWIDGNKVVHHVAIEAFPDDIELTYKNILNEAAIDA